MTEFEKQLLEKLDKLIELEEKKNDELSDVKEQLANLRSLQASAARGSTIH